ncbi:MAG: hypothetical protein MI700_04385, partial [Balneolales bacterium]|nr:hypothetical protein [Balneolales bacterium]
MRNLVSAYNRVSVKDELIDRILLTGTSIGFGVLIISLFPLDEQPLNLDLLLDCTAISFLFLTYFYRQKLTIYFKTNTILILVFAVVVSDLLEDGLYTPDSSLIVILPFLSILVYNFRVTLWIFLFCVATYFGIGVAIETGILESENYVVGTNSLFRWAEQIIALSVVIFVITLFLQKYMSVNNELIHSLENQNQELINRDTLLTAITQNIPRSYLSVFDENLVVQFTGGSEFDHHRINPDSFNGLRLEEIFKDVETKIYQSIKEAYEATLQGESQILEVQIEGNHYLHKTMPLTQHDGRINSMLSVVENITEQVKT